MKLQNITFTQAEEGAIPKEITVTMTLAEAVWIAKAAGKQPCGNQPTKDIWDALIGDVFNRYWDEGIDGAVDAVDA